ncbi:MAG: OprO/OprP family phosphate-selective porin [Phycisphaerales bacterium]
MRTSVIVIRAVVAAAAVALLSGPARAADPPGNANAAPALTSDEYERRIQQLENSIKDLRKDTRQLQVAGEEEAKLKPIAGWDKGFFIQSPDGANKLNVGGYVHFDGRYFLNSGDAGTNTFLFRRARLDLKGKFLKYYEFKFMPDFAGGQVVIQDAYLNVNYVPWARVQAGKYKSPTGLERLQSANAIMFIERALPTNLVPNRDLGFMLWGQPFYGALEYYLAVMDSAVDGGSLNNDTDLNDDKAFAGRVFALPFKDTTWEPLRGFGIGLSGTVGRQKGSITNPLLPQYRSDGQQVFFSYVTNSPATTPGTAFADGTQWRISPQGYWYWGPAGFLWEYVQSNNGVSFNGVKANVEANAWQTQFSYVVTGENNTFRGTTPAKNFDPWTFLDGNWGAVEVAARYSILSIDRSAFRNGFANPARSARAANAWALGVNWYLNPMVRLMLDFDRTTFNGGTAGGDRPSEQLIMSRVQFVF